MHTVILSAIINSLLTIVQIQVHSSHSASGVDCICGKLFADKAYRMLQYGNCYRKLDYRNFLILSHLKFTSLLFLGIPQDNLLFITYIKDSQIISLVGDIV